MLNKKFLLHEIRDYVVVGLATSLYAIGVTLFMLPYQLATGGVAGIGAIIYYATGMEIEVSYALINFILLAFGAKILGLRFSLKTIWGFGMISFWLWVCQRVFEDPVTHQLPMLLGESDMLLAVILTALLEGFALALCFHYRGSTGGTDIIAAIVNKYYDVSLGQIIIFMDILIVSSSYMVLHDSKKVIYGYVLLVLSGVILDWATRRFNQALIVYIFSRNYSAIADAVNKAGFGLTVLDGEGWYTKTERKVLMCVCTKRYSHEVMEVVKRVDPTAFVSVTNALNVYGEGFNTMKTKIKGQKPIIVFATNNANKLKEVRAILGDRFEVRSLKEIGCNMELPETHFTLEENSMEKARFLNKFYGFDCFADDTGLEVEALNGAPGVFSARYANHDEADLVVDENGLNKWGIDPTKDHDSEANMRKLIDSLSDKSSRKAQFRTSIALIYHGNEYLFEGVVKGDILKEKRGTEGFGYDPIFQPEGYDKSFAELGDEIKNKISHRGLATEKLAEFLLDSKNNKK